MSSEEIAIRARDISKHYMMFAKPEDRLKQMIVPRLQRALHRPPKQYFRDFAALNGLSFDIRRGETVGIIGRNGSGKSTLLQVVCGTLQPTSGSIAVNGRIAALLELGAGFNPEFTGRENVYLNAAILGLSRAETDARFDDIARFADIGEFIEHPVKTYSSGMYVRLAFATAINVDPDILVVDEALAVGDEAFQRKCFARIEQIKDKGGTILFVSHSAQTIVQLCDRAILVDRGELLLDGRPKLVTTHYQRLINASPELSEQTRENILAIRDGQQLAEPLSPVDTGMPAKGASQTSTQHPDTEPSDYYVPGLVSESTETLEENGARIRDIQILTLDGRRVNILRMGRRYIYQYPVDFTEPVKSAFFSMNVKSKTGIVLGGCRTPLPLPEGKSIVVQIEFNCAFLPGIYYNTCGVRTQSGVDSKILHRVIDATVMQVDTEPDLTITGYVDISTTARAFPAQ